MEVSLVRSAWLVLEDKTVFQGNAIGAEGMAIGEVVFNTSLTGYQEILTDPSYAKQIITLTYPHIGNVGCNPDDHESEKVWAQGLVIRNDSLVASNWRHQISLSDYLQKNGVVAISDVDTRELTRQLRDKGAQVGAIVTDELVLDRVLAAIRDFPGLKGMDLAKQVSTQKTLAWSEGVWDINEGYPSASEFNYKVVAYDYGVKYNILRLLVDRGCDVTLVPAQTSAADVLAMKPDGVFLSNGPGDPEACGYAIESIRTLQEHRVPLFGICLGYQLLALANGAQTLKMKFGHHGANHPVKDVNSGKVMITSQNHGFAVEKETLPDQLEVTHVSLFDKSLQGLKHKEHLAFGFQGHPEASPGPHDVAYLFDEFVNMMKANQ